MLKYYICNHKMGIFAVKYDNRKYYGFGVYKDDKLKADIFILN